MGQTTTNLGIWTPDEADTFKLHILLAAMAATIENGAGERLLLQEKAIGLKAGIASGTGIPMATAIAPFAITAANANFKQGLDIAGGIVTVETPGMYMVTASLGIQPKNPADRTTAVDIYKGSTKLSGAELLQSTNYYITSVASCIVNCVAGDTLYVKWHSAAPAGVSTAATLAADTALTQFTVAMVQAVPQ
jgi:hypothetical protein